MEFEKAKKILNAKKSIKYTDDEIKEITKLLEVFKAISVNNLVRKNSDEKCNSIR